MQIINGPEIAIIVQLRMTYFGYCKFKVSFSQCNFRVKKKLILILMVKTEF